jgi:hypothetical protein
MLDPKVLFRPAESLFTPEKNYFDDVGLCFDTISFGNLVKEVIGQEAPNW